MLSEEDSDASDILYTRSVGNVVKRTWYPTNQTHDASSGLDDISLAGENPSSSVPTGEKLPDDDTKDMARRQKIRRFLSNPRIFPYLFVSALVALICPLFQDASTLELVMDRTEWIRRGVPVNILDLQRTRHSIVLVGTQPSRQQQFRALENGAHSCDRDFAIRFMDSRKADSRSC